MRKFFELSLYPTYAYIAAIALAHGGNDKAPFLVMAAALFSMGVCVVYLISSIDRGHRRRSLRKAMIAGFPFILTGALFILARLHVIDIYPILGFR